MAEFALVFPVLVMFLLGCMEFGWYFLNYYAVSQYAHEIMKYAPEPRGDKLSTLSAWHDISVSKPSWMTAEEVASGYGNNYNGWSSFDEDREYFDSTLEEKMSYVDTLLNRDRIETTVTGGWLVKAVAEHDRPRRGMSPSLDYEYASPSLYVYADMNVEVSYTFYPLTFLGEMLFSTGGKDTCQLVVTERSEVTNWQFLNLWGI